MRQAHLIHIAGGNVVFHRFHRLAVSRFIEVGLNFDGISPLPLGEGPWVRAELGWMTQKIRICLN